MFCLAWFALALTPVLPLRDHVTEYYSALPAIGLAWLGGWAVAEARRSVALPLVALYAALMLPRTLAASNWNFGVSMRARNLVQGVARGQELHPRQDHPARRGRHHVVL